MLIISRKIGQGFKLILPNGGEVSIKLVQSRGQETKVSICAPSEICILRDELVQSVKNEI